MSDIREISTYQGYENKILKLTLQHSMKFGPPEMEDIYCSISKINPLGESKFAESIELNQILNIGDHLRDGAEIVSFSRTITPYLLDGRIRILK